MTITHPESFAAAPPRSLLSALSTFLQRFRAYRERRSSLKDDREAFLHVVYLDDRVLFDMGVTREEVEWAASLPLEVNAARALKERAERRRKSEA